MEMDSFPFKVMASKPDPMESTIRLTVLSSYSGNYVFDYTGPINLTRSIEFVNSLGLSILNEINNIQNRK